MFDHTLLGAGTQTAEQGSLLRDRLWPDEHNMEPSQQNPYWQELPLSYRLWPDEVSASTELLQASSQRAIRGEVDRLFAEFYEKEKDNWD